MKSSPTPAPRNHNASHPPLARNAQGHPIALPDGTASFAIKRETRGRPQVIKGPDGHPFRLPLEATKQDIRDNFGAGSFRLDALDTLGNVLDYVTTVEIVGEESGACEEDDERDGPRGSSDLRFALQTIMHMARAQSESIRAVTEAQADWVKGLAAARSLPRSAPFVPATALPPGSERDDDDDDDDDDGDDDERRNAGAPTGPPGPSPAPTWLTDLGRNLGFAVVPAVESFVARLMKRVTGPAAETSSGTSPPAGTTSTPTVTTAAAPSAATPNPMIHLAEINAGLTEDERGFLAQVLRSHGGEILATELLARDVDDAIAFIADVIAEVRDEQARAGGQSRTGATPPAPAKPGTPATGSDAFMGRVLAVAARLDADQRATVLALVPRLSPERVETLKTQLIAMTDDEATTWVRENLPRLCAEVAQ